MRLKYGLFLAEGEKCVCDTLGAFKLEALVALRSWLDAHEDIAGVFHENVYEASEGVIKKISSLSTPPEVLAVFRIPDGQEELPDLDGRLILGLDGIQDPGNLGTIIRTADWFGIDTIIASRDTVDVFNPKTVQSTMGSLKRVRIYYLDIPELIKAYPGMPVYGMMLEGENMFDSSLENHGFIIMGNEGNGLSCEVRGLVDHPLLIPPYNNDSHGESLNVAIATAITLATFRNK